jgi:S1-C subfamily serine protease
VEGQNIFIGEVFEGVNTTRANGFFSSALYSKPNKITLKILSGDEKAIFSLNGDIQFTSTAIMATGSGIGFGISGKGEINVSDLLQKEFDYNTQSDNKSSDDSYTSSGSGLILSRDGYLVTNHHVIEKGKAFEVVIFENGVPNRYKAKKINEDSDNDLAILKIEDENFKPFNKISYNFKTNQAINVGGSVFSIGFPLQSILGQEPKFVDGKISSKTGFKNSISTFQTTVPIQPGNSGSPLFNDKGDLIAIMNAVVSNTDNVSYGIKIGFLQNLIDLIPVAPELPNTPIPENTKTEEMVKILTKYVVFIKVK